MSGPDTHLKVALSDYVEARAVARNPDAAIIEAWDRWAQAHTMLSIVPDEPPYINHVNAAQREQYDIMEAAEAVILPATPKTPLGIEIQILLAAHLGNHVSWADDVQAAKKRDLDALTEQLGENDMVVIAIRSLRAMQEAGR